MAFRVQRNRRSKPGIPPGAVYVGRPSQWGNPAKIGEYYRLPGACPVLVSNNYLAVDLFYQYCKRFALEEPERFLRWVYPLIEKNLCCWCSLGEVCHADVLLFIVRSVKPVFLQVDQVGELLKIVEKWPPLSDFIRA